MIPATGTGNRMASSSGSLGNSPWRISQAQLDAFEPQALEQPDPMDLFTKQIRSIMLRPAGQKTPGASIASMFGAP